MPPLPCALEGREQKWVGEKMLSDRHGMHPSGVQKREG